MAAGNARTSACQHIDDNGRSGYHRHDQRPVPCRKPPLLPHDDLVSRLDAERIDRILLSGGGARIKGLAQILAERQKVPVDIVDPLRRITYAPEVFGAEDPKTVGAQLTVSVGLALRKAQEK